MVSSPNLRLIIKQNFCWQGGLLEERVYKRPAFCCLGELLTHRLASMAGFGWLEEKSLGNKILVTNSVSSTFSAHPPFFTSASFAIS
jgi:hypothetical protein